jgi:preprotein translocase subunit SecA
VEDATRQLLRFLFSRSAAAEPDIEVIECIRSRRRELAEARDDELRAACANAQDLPEVVAVTAEVAKRVVGLDIFDVQIRGALALAEGKIAEMQTGEGKTVTSVPAVVWYARSRQGVHVMTVNDYLARRDSKWMGGIYEFIGLSVGCIQQGMRKAERQRAYACDVTYATANEVGFDYLRDQLALDSRDQVHRPFAAALIDEADSILLDEARIPLVIAGGEIDDSSLAYHVDRAVRHFRPFVHYTVDEYGRNVALTDAGVQVIEKAFGCRNLFDEANFPVFTAVQQALHAYAFLRRDVDYLVKNGAIESVDEFKGRVVQERRWPAGLQTAIEAMENVAAKKQGSILGSITLENLIALYPRVCGMTGTAKTRAREFQDIYGLDVVVIPPNRPVIRIDHPDAAFDTKEEKERALIASIHRTHEMGRPVLVGTVSVQESERLSAQLRDTPHRVLNARNEEEEAGIIARAGELGAVTISTNMAGRGTDIRLGEGVAALGGLHVIGTNRHESRRIDNQLRGRAGRQGDPGTSQLFVSLQDDLMVKYGSGNHRLRFEPESIQRVVEGQNLEIRRFLHKYESVLEGQRHEWQGARQAILTGETPSATEIERLVTLTAMDELWSAHLAAVTECREGIRWISLGNYDPLREYLTTVERLFNELYAKLAEEIPMRMAAAQASGIDPSQRGATWTYLTSDQPFGSATERMLRGFMQKAPRIKSTLQILFEWAERSYRGLRRKSKKRSPED